MHLNTIAEQHHEWLEKMGWTNQTPLEDIALIASTFTD